MKLNLIARFTLAFYGRQTSAGQAQQAATAAKPATNYDYHETFGPLFYNKNGSEYRCAADGEPGPKYWQNKADYQISGHFKPGSQ